MNKISVAFSLAAALSISASTVPAQGADDAATAAKIEIGDKSFKCLAQMTKVKHFYVDNLLGNLEGTVKVAKSEKGGVYPPGSVVQLVPGEVMVKHKPGYNAATRDWEFFELNASATGTTIGKRGFVDVVNRFGGNCFGCHAQARPEFDLICEADHGCKPIPVTREQIAKIQADDPRCKPAANAKD